MDSADAIVLRRAASDNCSHNVDVAARAGHPVTHRPCTPISTWRTASWQALNARTMMAATSWATRSRSASPARRCSGLRHRCVCAPQCKGAFVSRMHSASLMAGILDQHGTGSCMWQCPESVQRTALWFWPGRDPTRASIYTKFFCRRKPQHLTQDQTTHNKLCTLVPLKTTKKK